MESIFGWRMLLRSFAFIGCGMACANSKSEKFGKVLGVLTFLGALSLITGFIGLLCENW